MSMLGLKGDRPSAIRDCLKGDVPLAPIAAKRRRTRIFFIDDDLLYAEPLVVELAEQGFEVQHFAETVQLEALLAQPDGPDILLLDWHLPKSSGIAIAQSLRRRGMKLPIVFLTGRNYIEDERQAFECGAADFVAKSKGVETLVWRLKRVAANLPGAGNLPTIPSAAADGRLNLYRQTSRATWDGIDLDLTLGEYNVVELLALNASNYISYRALYDVVRAPGFVSGQGPDGFRANVRSTIKRARNKFRVVDADFRAIESYMSFGYRWRSDV
jgi:two-component system, OmpR family, response regulator ChvI